MTRPYRLTKVHLISLGPCALDRRLKLFGGAKSLTASQALQRGFTASDILWVAGKLGRGLDCVRAAIRFAEAVAHLNTDPRVKEAIDAAKNYVENPSDSFTTRAALNAATRADYAAHAALNDATRAAYSAHAALNAAAYTAYAAAYTAYAAYYATRAVHAADNISIDTKAIIAEIFG